MKTLIATVLGATALFGVAAPALANDYRDDRRGGYGDDRRDYGDNRRGYDDDSGHLDDDRDRRFANRVHARGEGWSVLRSIVPDLTRDRRQVRWTLARFDRNRDGVLDRYEGYRARAAFTRQGRGNGYGYGGGYAGYDNRDRY